MNLITEYPLHAIVSLVDNHNKLVYTIYSNSMLIELSKNITSLKINEHPCKDLQESFNNGYVSIVIDKSFNCYTPRQELLAEYVIINDVYKSNGYRDLRPKLPKVKYKLKTYVLDNFYQSRNGSKPLVYVVAKISRHIEYVLAILDSKPEAKEWIASNYPNGKCEKLIIHNNRLTFDYIKFYGDKLFRQT